MAFYIARKLAATLLCQDANDPMAAQELKEAGVPVSEDSCRTCADPCDEGHEEFSKRFDVDMETDMRGSVKPYRRQVLISTGKADWVREVTYESNSLAKFISSAEDKHSDARKNPPPAPSAENDSKEAATGSGSGSGKTPAGVYSYKPSGRLSILNGSHHSISEDRDTQATILVLPDFVAVSNVPVSATGADAFWKHALDPAVPRAGTILTPGGEEFQSWTLPYNCLILLCSHKKRDARCHIASERLEEDFARTLQSEGWHVDTDLDHGELAGSNRPLESAASTDEARQEIVLAQLRALTGTDTDDPVPTRDPSHDPQSESEDVTENRSRSRSRREKDKKALILKNSHIGGHKFAGNVIIYFPQGSSIWYGRVTPHHVHSVVQHTILQGKILPQLFRGGLGIVRPAGCSSLLDW